MPFPHQHLRLSPEPMPPQDQKANHQLDDIYNARHKVCLHLVAVVLGRLVVEQRHFMS